VYTEIVNNIYEHMVNLPLSVKLYSIFHYMNPKYDTQYIMICYKYGILYEQLNVQIQTKILKYRGISKYFSMIILISILSFKLRSLFTFLMKNRLFEQ